MVVVVEVAQKEKSWADAGAPFSGGSDGGGRRHVRGGG